MDNFENFRGIHPSTFEIGVNNVKRSFKRFERYISVRNGVYDDQLKVNLLVTYYVPGHLTILSYCQKKQNKYMRIRKEIL